MWVLSGDPKNELMNIYNYYEMIHVISKLLINE